MQKTFLKIYQEHKQLLASLNDARSVMYKINVLLTFLTLALCFFICLAIYGGNIANVLISISTLILAYAVLFGMATLSLFQAIIYILSVHPYDVGDQYVLAEGTMTVKQVGFLMTDFLTPNGVKILYPTAILIQKPVINVSRSGSMLEAFSFHIELLTSMEKIKELEDRFGVLARSYPALFDPKIGFLLSSIDVSNNSMELTLWLKGWSNFHYGGTERTKRRNLAMSLMQTAIKDLQIKYENTPLPVYVIHGAKTETTTK